jgi:hypothetical protein
MGGGWKKKKGVGRPKLPLEYIIRSNRQLSIAHSIKSMSRKVSNRLLGLKQDGSRHLCSTNHNK